MEIALVVIVSYFIGSISFAVLISKMAGLGDITKHGSGNPGATNMARLGGKKLAALNLILDALKGTLAVYIGQQLGFPVIAFVAVVMGHCFTVFLKFKGGKGVATTIGALLLLNLHIGVTAIVIWVITFLVFRISSLAALLAINLTMLKVAIWYNMDPMIWGLIIVSLLITYKHKANIKRLINGTEK